MFVAMGMTWAQSFSDDFESYDTDSYLGASSETWTTWSGSTGSNEDVKITEAKANSGTKSIYFSSTSNNGGPQDVVLPFGNKYTTGAFSFTTSMYVESSAYFNFQAETTIGTTWALDCRFNEDGTIAFSNSSTILLSTTYPQNKWFDVVIDINLDNNSWTLKIDGDCRGGFENPTNSVASIDIFPLGGNKFYIDDVSFTYLEVAPEVTRDAVLTMTTTANIGIAGETVQVTGAIENKGSEVINAVMIEAVSGDVTDTIMLTDLNLEKGQRTEFSVEDDLALTEEIKSINLSIASINNGTYEDQESCNNSASVSLQGFKAAANKNIVVEEGTGTWCGWCPRGAVFLDYLSAKYPNRFIGIAVHNSDPMEVKEYNDGLAFQGFPNAKVNRGSSLDPSELEQPFLEAIGNEANSILVNGAKWDDSSRKLDVSVNVKALKALSNGNKIAVVLTEDDVKGTGDNWIQANYYSGQSDLIAIDGTNWKDLPSGVETDYDHVARALLTPYSGLEDSFVDGLAQDETKIFNMSYTLPADFNVEKMHIVAMVLDENGGINTGSQSTVQEAIAHGFEVTDNINDVVDAQTIMLAPNPASSFTTLSMNISYNTTLNAQVVDINGKVLMSKSYDVAPGLFNTQIDCSQLSAGTYFVKLNADGSALTKRLIIAK